MVAGITTLFFPKGGAGKADGAGKASAKRAPVALFRARRWCTPWDWCELDEAQERHGAAAAGAGAADLDND